MFTIILRKTMVNYQETVVNRLKCPADRKAEAASFALQKETRQFFSESELRIRVIEINQAKRDVNDRHLHSKLDADARTKIAELIKHRVVNANDVVALSFTAQENLFDAGRQTDGTAETVAAAENVDELGFRQNLIVKKQDASETVFQIRRVPQSERRHDARAQKRVVRQKFTVNLLRSGFSQVEHRTDVGKQG